MTAEILPSYRLKFDFKATNATPAKLAPGEQTVVFRDEHDNRIELTRATLLKLADKNGDETMKSYGLSGEVIAEALLMSDYSELRPIGDERRRMSPFKGVHHLVIFLLSDWLSPAIKKIIGRNKTTFVLETNLSHRAH
jgi:hypothetical protein